MSRLMVRRRGSAFSPLTLGPALWFDAATIPLADGAAVSQWDDRSGNARHATQATSGKRPVLRTSGVNGRPAVDFDGTDDELITPAYTNGPAVSLFVVAQLDVVTTGDAFRHFAVHGARPSWTSPYARWALRAESDGVEWVGWVNDGNNVAANYVLSSTPTAVAGQPFILEMSYDGAALDLHRNGTLLATKARTGDITGTNDTTRLGSRGGGEYLNGRMSEVIVYEKAVSASDRLSLRRHLAAKHGITIA